MAQTLDTVIIGDNDIIDGAADSRQIPQRNDAEHQYDKNQAEIDQGYLALECFRRHGRAPASRGKPEDDPAGGLSFQICLSGSKNRRCFPHA